MVILAVDATGDGLSAALSAGGRVYVARRGPKTPHDESLLPAVEGLLKRAGLRWEDLDAVAAAAGPGRFTGIRVGMAFAAAAGFRLGVPALAVSRLEALAGRSGAKLARAALSGWKGEVYHQLFRRTRAGLSPAGPAAWTPPEEWTKLREAAESRGETVVFADADAADVLAAAAARLAAKRLPPFEPFYLKPAGYEKARR